MLAYTYNHLRKTVSWEARVWFKKQKWFTPVTKILLGSDVYCESYFANIEQIEKASVASIAAWIVANLKPNRVADVGCGPGHMMQALQELDVVTFGVDIAKAALKMSKAKGLKVQEFDLRRGAPLEGAPYDVVVCCEVAEHLEAKHAPQLVLTLTEAGRIVFLTAAEPDPRVGPGLHHVNEQPNSYWIELMRARGWDLDAKLTESARKSFEENGVIRYLQKAMVFKPQSSV
jgi:2-polyprenyl-3-methyl-5-hydroxy-6-metoxy-1,4-benzoquinol methylase